MAVEWYCKKCGCKTANRGEKPPEKWNRACSGGRNGLHSWVKKK